ncbi:TPA: hypothetical protein ACVFDW_000697 [Haemophilus influenzae]
MFRILFAVALLWAAYELNLNQDCDGYICDTSLLITALTVHTRSVLYVLYCGFSA